MANFQVDWVETNFYSIDVEAEDEATAMEACHALPPEEWDKRKVESIIDLESIWEISLDNNEAD